MKRIAAVLVAALFSAGAAAQGWPARPVRILCPYPGGPVDLSSRVVAQKLQEPLGQPVRDRLVLRHLVSTGSLGVERTTTLHVPIDPEHPRFRILLTKNGVHELPRFVRGTGDPLRVLVSTRL